MVISSFITIKISYNKYYLIFIENALGKSACFKIAFA